MNEVAWKRLLDLISHGSMVPVIGPHLLEIGGQPLYLCVAEKLLESYGQASADLPAGQEIDTAIGRLQGQAKLQDLYADVHDILTELTRLDTTVSTPIRQLAEISDFRLYVSLTPDTLLARALNGKRTVSEVIHAPQLASSASRDLEEGYETRADEVHLLYLFGRSSVGPNYALHDEDILEYANNLIVRGSQSPNRFLGALTLRNLLFLGCNSPEWLSRFFLRLIRGQPLSVGRKTKEWLINGVHPEARFTTFLRQHSKETEVLDQQSPAAFIAELYRRWLVKQGERISWEPMLKLVPPSPIFFISYARSSDLHSAQTLYEALRALGAEEREIWFDRQTVEPGQDFKQHILDGIRGCYCFLPVLSDAVHLKKKGFVFTEWHEAEQQRTGVNRDDCLIPLVVETDYQPERHTGPQAAIKARPWEGLHLGHAPEGLPNEETLQRLTKVLRTARSPALGGLNHEK